MNLQPVAKAKAVAICAFILALAGGTGAQDTAGLLPADYPRLYVFFTPTDSIGASADHRLKLLPPSIKARLVPELLLDDPKALVSLETAAPGRGASTFSRLVESVKALEEIIGKANLSISVFNTEGLALARRFAIKATPAFVFAPDPGHAHVAYGAEANLQELVSCKKK